MVAVAPAVVAVAPKAVVAVAARKRRKKKKGRCFVLNVVAAAEESKGVKFKSCPNCERELTPLVKVRKENNFNCFLIFSLFVVGGFVHLLSGQRLFCVQLPFSIRVFGMVRPFVWLFSLILIALRV